jgi:hypothetical protein
MTDLIGSVTGALKSILAGQTLTIGNAAFRLNPFDPPPPKLDTADLVAAYTFTGSASYDYDSPGRGHVRETRIYRVQFAVLTVAEATPELREVRVRPWLDLARARLSSYPTLNRLRYVERARPLRDTGVVILPEYGGNYLGFELQLSVTMDLPIEYALGEK